MRLRSYTKLLFPSAMIFSTVLLSQAARAGSWQVTVSSTNSSPAPTNDSSVVALAFSRHTSAVATVSASGTSASTVGGSATASYSGTWTFTWIPDNSTDWPSAYTITSVATRIFVVTLLNSSGTAQVSTDSITLPGSPTAEGSGVPAVTSTTDTSTPNLAKITKNSNLSQHDAAVSGGWLSEQQSVTVVTRSYTSTYFTTNFSTPSAVTLSFSVSGGGSTASLSNYTSTSSSGSASVLMQASDLFSGQ